VKPKYADLQNEVVRRCPSGHPLVYRCHPVRVVAGRTEPFPTLYWLACDDLHRQIARIEADGGVDRAREWMRADEGRLAAMVAAHDEYIAERESLLTGDERAALADAGLLDNLRRRGIGGIVARDAVKCLHLHFAHHLARRNVVGAWLDDQFELVRCPAP